MELGKDEVDDARSIIDFSRVKLPTISIKNQSSFVRITSILLPIDRHVPISSNPRFSHNIRTSSFQNQTKSHSKLIAVDITRTQVVIA
jgi:hypothetical protein